MTDSAPTGLAPGPQGLVDYARSLDCIHCGLCLHTCPTYQLTGREGSSPRGRIHLMRAVAEERLTPDAAFREELDFCLVCRHCESVCPAGVEFGRMMAFSRDRLERAAPRGPLVRLARWIGFGLVLPRRRALRAAVTLLGLAQRSGLLRVAGRLLRARGAALCALPPVPPRAARAPLPARTPAREGQSGRAWMLAGCVMPELYGRVNRATLACLVAAGDEVLSAPQHTCCGALHAHNGELGRARALARSTIEAFGGDEPVVVNSAGCGAHMKEYGHLLAEDPAWRARAAAFAARVVDFAEHLSSAGRAARLARALEAGGGGRSQRAAYDDPCHLCHGQGVRDAPRLLLDLVPGLERRELPNAEGCCGSAGIYSLLRPADSNAIFARKHADLATTDAEVLVTANPGCQLQWETGLARAGSQVRVAHLAEVLARALPGARP